MALDIDLSGAGGMFIIPESNGSKSVKETDPFILALKAAESQYRMGHPKAAMHNIVDAARKLASDHGLSVPYLG